MSLLSNIVLDMYEYQHLLSKTCGVVHEEKYLTGSESHE